MYLLVFVGLYAYVWETKTERWKSNGYGCSEEEGYHEDKAHENYFKRVSVC